MDFWGSLDNLVLSHKLVIDRPRAHVKKGGLNFLPHTRACGLKVLLDGQLRKCSEILRVHSLAFSISVMSWLVFPNILILPPKTSTAIGFRVVFF
jgi:hypothetical protein